MKTGLKRLFVLSGVLVSAAPAAMLGQEPIRSLHPTTITSSRHTHHHLYREAQGGNVSAQAELARRYRVGDGIRRNELEAAFWYQKAAAHGDPEAAFQLGLMYLEGVGLTESSVDALHWISVAARDKHPQAMELYHYILEHDEPLAC